MSTTRRAWGGSVAALAVVLAGHLTLYPKIADLDGFYHIGHASLYAETSPFDTALPWATQSAVRDRGADIWWGFHVVLMPFAAIDGVEWRIRAAALCLTLVLAGTFLLVLRRHDVPGPGWWTAGFLLAVPNVFFRHLMMRPHMLSLAGALVLSSVLMRGSWTTVLLVSALVTWLHLGLFWMAPAITAAYALVRIAERLAGSGDASARVAEPPHTPDRRVAPRVALAAAFAGSAVGWLLRPHPFEAAALAGVQTFTLFAEKAAGEPTLVAAELQPIFPAELVRTSWLFLAAWAAAAVAAARLLRPGAARAPSSEARTLLLTSHAVAGAFLLVALLSARRALVEWVAFGSLGLAAVGPVFGSRLATMAARTPVRVGVAALLVAHFGWAVWRHRLNVDIVAFDADTMAAPAAYLAANSEPGDVVFHAKWDSFGPLFARNRRNFYLGGMDPIFQLAHDRRSYWEFFYLSADATTEWTCDAYPCETGNATDTHVALRDHFGARWIVVEPYRNPRLTLYLLNDDRYRLALESESEAVFEILPDPAEGV